MKRILMLAALCVSALSVSLLSAAPTAHVRLNQPTLVGESTLPVGEYTIQLMSGNGDVPVILVQGKDKSAMILVNHFESRKESQNNSEIILSKTNDIYKLTKVVIDGQSYEVQ